MQVKLDNVISAFDTINNILGNKLSANFAFKLMGIANVLRPEFEKFDEIRKNKVVEHGGTEAIEADPAKKESFINEMVEFVQNLIEVNIEKLSPDDFSNEKDLKLSGHDIARLTWMLDI